MTLRPLVVAALTTVTLTGLSLLLRGAGPAALDDQAGTIRPEPWSAWLTVLGGILVFVVAFWAAIYAGGGWAAAAMALVGAACAGFMAPSVTAVHAVHWNERGMEGPARTLGPTLGTARTEIAWSDIVRTGTSITHYWYVESRDGRRIYWSYLYKGYGSLTSALRRHCPSLQLSF